MANGLPLLPPAIEVPDELGNRLHFFTAEQMSEYGSTCFLASLPESKPPIAWIATQSLDGTRHLDLGLLTANPNEVSLRTEWKWIPLFASRFQTE